MGDPIGGVLNLDTQIRILIDECASQLARRDRRAHRPREIQGSG